MLQNLEYKKTTTVHVRKLKNISNQLACKQGATCICVCVISEAASASNFVWQFSARHLKAFAGIPFKLYMVDAWDHPEKGMVDIEQISRLYGANVYALFISIY